MAEYLSALHYIVGFFREPPTIRRQLKIAIRGLLPAYRRYMADKDIRSFVELEEFGREWERLVEMDHQYHPPPVRMRLRMALPKKKSSKVASVQAITVESSESDEIPVRPSQPQRGKRNGNKKNKSKKKNKKQSEESSRKDSAETSQHNLEVPRMESVFAVQGQVGQNSQDVRAPAQSSDLGSREQNQASGGAIPRPKNASTNSGNASGHRFRRIKVLVISVSQRII